jgi:pimeloyl-ACP methyl ester carboxylesterase
MAARLTLQPEAKTERWKSRFLTSVLTVASSGLILRDRLTGVTRRLRKHDAREEFFIASGERKLACTYVRGIEGGPVILLCHGIGETVEHWSVVQALFHDRGIGSLVFNYSGYGRSTGWVRAEHCDEDLVAAYSELRRRVESQTQVFVLGYSLGSGIAAHGAAALVPAVAGLFLCEAFDSFRNAACSVGVPQQLAHIVTDVWVTVRAVEHLHMPVWVIHSDGDQLFPLEMPRRIKDACGFRSELIIVKGFAHNEPFLTAAEAYWQPIIERIVSIPREIH